MYRVASFIMLIAFAMPGVAQNNAAAALFAPQTTIPVAFIRTVSARQAHVGDAVSARTIQDVRLANGTLVPSGSRVVGHVMEAIAAAKSKVPYATQPDSMLSVHFDSVATKDGNIPLNVTIRAMADVFASNAAREPKSSDMDSLGTLTLVGGEYFVPSQAEVRDMNGDVVGYNHHGSVYGHLIANGRCDAGSTEVAMGIYAASACGLYGYPNVSATAFGSNQTPSTLTLVSNRTYPSLWKGSTALLEVLR